MKSEGGHSYSNTLGGVKCQALGQDRAGALRKQKHTVVGVGVCMRLDREARTFLSGPYNPGSRVWILHFTLNAVRSHWQA